MTAPMPRETATEIADRPHPFLQTGRVCATCGGAVDDELHVYWVNAEKAAANERASAPLEREIGS